jgi:demethylmenaquinone methyltransferase/2-methoxy-6-polyprenyl-1,4-benzoquinol methylase
VPLVGARLANDADAYRYLPRSSAYLPPPSELLALVEAAGFMAVERRTFTAGAVQLVTGTRR